MSTINSLVYSPQGGHDSPLQYSCLENPHGQRSLAGYSPWCCKELDMTERQNTFTYQVRSANSKTEGGQLAGQPARRVQHTPSVTGSFGHMQFKSLHLDPVTELCILEVREDKATAFI